MGATDITMSVDKPLQSCWRALEDRAHHAVLITRLKSEISPYQNVWHSKWKGTENAYVSGISEKCDW